MYFPFLPDPGAIQQSSIFFNNFKISKRGGDPMEASKITKQMIGFQKAMFENTYTVMTVIQDYSGNMMHGYLKQFPWITEETRKPLADSIEFLKTARNDYKKAVEQGFERWEEQAEIN
jgi:hypothetical protein